MSDKSQFLMTIWRGGGRETAAPPSRYAYFCGCAGLAVPLDGVVFVPLGMLAAELDSNDCADFTKDCGFSFSSSLT